MQHLRYIASLLSCVVPLGLITNTASKRLTASCRFGLFLVSQDITPEIHIDCAGQELSNRLVPETLFNVRSRQKQDDLHKTVADIVPVCHLLHSPWVDMDGFMWLSDI
ncbi:hypothetical protein V1264_016841 [Littorina saxatilis]|uniref:Secreted protein n=1 Tax=Littorina saxatilis TaxID=31220 RepID=A0AAN9GF48_9CAEN